MSMNPRKTTERIKQDYREYIASILNVKDAEITALANEAVNRTEFAKGPYLETTLPFEDAHSLKQLAAEGLVSNEFGKMGQAIHFADWKLRVHQEEALRKVISENRNIVVSTGTGSGKTECYLYPIFDALMREKEAGTLDAGVRALLIFPMNALANDQQKKLRKLLRAYPDITFGRYTGETAHKQKKETVDGAEKRLHDEYDREHTTDSDDSQRKSIPNEIMCREMMAEKPPHILLTNYAMLEYMLLRPDTAPFFDNSSAKNWRFIVIDEAHTYKGATGTEIAFLIRRLKERLRHRITKPFKCIATSATLGSDDGKADLAQFAENLFGEPFEAEDIITTKRKQRVPPANGRRFSPEEYLQIKSAASNMDESKAAAFIFDALSDDLRLFDVYEALRKRPKRIEEVAGVVFPDVVGTGAKETALIDLIELGARAKKTADESALLPARYHLFIKSLEGMFAQLYPRKAVFLDRKEMTIDGSNSYAVFELANCQKCEQEYIVGKTIDKDGHGFLAQSSGTDKPEYYFIANGENDNFAYFDEDDTIEETEKLGNLDKYNLCLCCGRITPFSEKPHYNCCDVPDTKKYVTVYNLKYVGREKESNCCPCCGATRKGLIKRFLTANQPATIAVAKSLYEAIPPRPSKHQPVSYNELDIFSDPIFDTDPPNITHESADESGRKLLVFSDNRQEAAFFAGFFDKKYCLIMWRKVILLCLKREPNGLVIDDLIDKVVISADRAGLFSFDLVNSRDLTDNQKRKIATRYVMQEFMNPDVSTGLEGLGFIKIAPEQLNLKDTVEFCGLRGNEVWLLLRFFMDTLRQKGAVSFPEGLNPTDDFFAPRNHAGYFRKQTSGKDRGVYVYGFVPAENAVNKRLAFVHKLLKDQLKSKDNCESAARDKLGQAYDDFLMNVMDRAKYGIQTQDSSKGVVNALNYAKWRFSYISDDETLYRCDKCGKVFSYSVNSLCPEMKCDGKLVPVLAGEVQKSQYYSRLYEDESLIPMVAKEHTAQLSIKTASDYQRQFEDGKINVLSCSTTFEMGVDVGELEATFLRNVPPETANYIQRAGRAGRRTSSAAFSVTFARRSSHDMTFFNDPARIIAGRIAVPVLEIKNDKIAERHVNSIVISWFLKKRREFFDGRSKRIVSFDDSSDNMAIALRKCLQEHPDDLLESIHAAMPDEICRALNVDAWAFIDNIVGDDGSLTKAITERHADIEGLRAFSTEAGKDRTRQAGKAYAAEKLISTLDDEPTINFLSAKGVLPKYGFPIDTVSLDVISGSIDEAKRIDLARDLRVAISEFAPPAQVVANGKVWRSHALNTIPNKSWPAYVYYECPKCKKIQAPNVGMIEATASLEEVAEKKVCDSCGTLMDPKKFIVPVFGFSTQMDDNPKPVGDNRPRSYYATRTQFWGIDSLTERQKSEAKERIVELKGKTVEIVYSPGGKLFVLNQGNNNRGLKICPVCGFAADPATPIDKHENKFKRRCANTKMVFASLGHSFSTDVLRIKLPMHDAKVDFIAGSQQKDQYVSILYAILEGASIALDINRSDINGCITGESELVLFDDTPGGSGFVKRIFSNFETVLLAAKNKVSGSCGCNEETSCYACLRNYSNQYYHDELSRGLANRYLDWLLNKQIDRNDTILSKKESTRPLPLVGSLSSGYEAIDTESFDDSVTVLRQLIDETDSMSEKSGLNELLMAIAGIELEHPIIDDCIQLGNTNVWPDIFWGKSQVALFSLDREADYERLRKYDWYCFIINEEMDADMIVNCINRKKGDG